MAFIHSRAQMSGLFLLAIVVLELALVSEHITSVEAGKKKKIMKKIKDMLPMMMMMMVCSAFNPANPI